MFEYSTILYAIHMIPPYIFDLPVSLDSILYGKSSAVCGENYNPERKKRMVICRQFSLFLQLSSQPGVPLEFPNVCKAMQFFQIYKNLNFKTQAKEMQIYKYK